MLRPIGLALRGADSALLSRGGQPAHAPSCLPSPTQTLSHYASVQMTIGPKPNLDRCASAEEGRRVSLIEAGAPGAKRKRDSAQPQRVVLVKGMILLTNNTRASAPAAALPSSAEEGSSSTAPHTSTSRGSSFGLTLDTPQHCRSDRHTDAGTGIPAPGSSITTVTAAGNVSHRFRVDFGIED